MIYLIINKSQNECKIGFSNSPENRVKELQTSHSCELKIQNIIKGSPLDEHQLHKFFAKYKIRGEWFRLTDEITDYFNCQPQIPFTVKPARKIEESSTLKMAIYPNQESWIMHCDNIGEAKLFGHILATSSRPELNWSLTELQKTMLPSLGLKEATVKSYLKNLCKNKLLIKLSSADYQVNNEYIKSK